MRLGYSGPEGPPTQSKVKHYPAPNRKDGRGLDLTHHFREVRSVIFGSYTRRCEAQGVDPEDLLSTVYASILKSNTENSAYDPAKSSVIRYLHLLTASRLSHLRDTERRRHHGESAAYGHTPDGDGSRELDPSLLAVGSQGGADPEAVIDRLLPLLVQEAREEDHLEGDTPPSLFALFGEEDPDDLTNQGWREQAIRWAVESPDPTVLMNWWRCGRETALERLEWGRDRWREALQGALLG